MFDQNTRQRFMPMTAMVRPTGGGSSIQDLPRNGFLSGVIVAVTATVTGTLSNPNALGAASIIRRVRLSLNNGVDVFNVDGASLYWLLPRLQGYGQNVTPQTDAMNAVTATTFRLDFYIPVQMNDRDPIGLILLQNEQITATLIIDWAADADVATGATVTATATPECVVFDVPRKFEDYPPISPIHAFISDQMAVSASGEFTYSWPRTNTYLQVAHLFPGAWTRYQLRAQGSIYLHDFVPATHRVQVNRTWGSDIILAGGAITGVDKRIFIDFMASDGLGNYGTVRDAVNSGALTDLATIITATAPSTLYTLRRMLIPIVPQA